MGKLARFSFTPRDPSRSLAKVSNASVIVLVSTMATCSSRKTREETDQTSCDKLRNNYK